MKRQFDAALGRFRTLAALNRESVHPVVDARAQVIPGTQLHQSVFGLHLRALAWAHSIRRLDDVFDFQAHSVGCRSLFEIVIDLVLLTRGIEPVEKLVEWERLAKFRSAEKAVSYAGGDAFVKRAAADFIEANRSLVAAAQSKFWPKNKKPRRWTGMHLFGDSVRADKCIPLKLEELARDEYERLCWNTHGSGLISVRTISADLFPGLAILPVHHSFHMLKHVIRLVLEHFELFDDGWGERIKLAYVGEHLEAYRKSLDAIAGAPGVENTGSATAPAVGNEEETKR